MDAHGPPELLVALYASDDLDSWEKIAEGPGWVVTSRWRGDREFYRMTTKHPTDD